MRPASEDSAIDPTSRFDAVVIGGGPAGSSAAIRLARLGRSVLVLEAARFPRFHIGESLLPASNAVFAKLGLDERVAAEGYVEKRGASFAGEDGETSSYVDFSTAPGVDAPRTWQVPRDRFDAMLLEHSAREGAIVRQPARAREVDFSPDGVRVRFDHAAETPEVTAEVLVDASGQAGFLAKRLGLRRIDESMRHVATFAHFTGVDRPAGERAGDIRVVSRRDLGWIWVIPLSDTVTSVGVVVPREIHAERARDVEGREELLDALLAESPEIARQMTGARRIGAVHHAADYSYTPAAYAGDRWLLAGDAGSFLDPVFSSGVLLALESGVEAADAIDRALSRNRNTPSARAFAAFERTQRRRYRYFRRFVRGFYDPGFRDLFLSEDPPWGLDRAVASALAGHWRPSIGVRLKLAIFFALTRAQRFVPLAPRVHGPAGAPASVNLSRRRRTTDSELREHRSSA